MNFTSRLPSPALVVASIALCAAVAGGAIAGTHTAPRAKLTKSSVKKIAKKSADKEIVAKAPGLSVARAQTAASADSVSTVGVTRVVKLTPGQTQTVFSKGPLSFVASCVTGGGASRNLTLMLKSAEAGSAYDGGGGLGDSFGPGDDVPVVDVNNAGPAWAGFNLQVVTPSGVTLAGHGSGGVNVLGSDCAAALTMVG